MTDDNWVPFNEESEVRRNDSELKAKVAKVVRARQKALKDASALLKQAEEILSGSAVFVGDEIYYRQYESVRMASFTLRRDAAFAKGPREDPAENDIYLGNLAAGSLGVQIQKMGDEFPL
jgi:hypothetical protein